jgi:hypothetical protein
MKQTYAKPDQVATYVKSVTHKAIGGEDPVHEVCGSFGVRIGRGRAVLLSSTHAADLSVSHEAGDLVTSEIVSGT